MVTPNLIILKCDGLIGLICDDHRLTVSPRLRFFPLTTMKTENFMEFAIVNRYFLKVYLGDVRLLIPWLSESKLLVNPTTPWAALRFSIFSFCLHISSGIFQAAIDEVIYGMDRLLSCQNDAIIVLSAKAEDSRSYLVFGPMG